MPDLLLRTFVLVGRAAMPFALVVGLSWIDVAPASAQVKEITTLKNLAGKDVDLAPFKVDARKLSTLRGSIFPLVGAGKAAGQQLADFETYYLIRIAELTWPTKDGAEIKRGLIKRDLRQYGAAPALDLHDLMNKMMLQHLPALAADKETPLDARYNALILLGQIDRVEPDATQARPAVPLAEVTPILIGAADKQDLAESLRIAALVGLARQSELQVVGGARPPIAAAAAKIIASKRPLPGYSAAGHNWARKLALQIVVGLAKTGGDMDRPETVKALHDILADPNEPLFLRRDAALALGNLSPSTLAAAGQVKPADLLKALSNFTAELMRAGSPRPDPTAEPKLSKAEDVFLAPTDATKKLYTDGLSYYLNCVATALGGRNNRGMKAIPGLDPKLAPLVNELLTSYVDGAVGAMGGSKVIAAQLPRDMSDRGAKLATWITTNGLDVKPAAAAAAAAAPAITGP